MGSNANQFLEAFARFRDRPCLIDGATGRSFSYGEVFSLACAYRDSLKESGVEMGDTIVFVSGNRIELAISYFAVLLGGMRAVPIDPLKGESEIASILEQLEPRLLVTDDVTRFASSSIKMLDIGTYPRDVPPIVPSAFDGSLDLEATFLVTFTSGTTGKPKGVMHSLGNFIRTATAFSSRFGFGPDNIFYHNLPMTYMAGILNQIFQPIIAGATLVIGPRFSVSNVASFWQTPTKYGVNTFWFNPSMLALLLKLDRGNEGIEFARGRTITGCVGTAPLSPRVKEEFQKKYGIDLYESYGLSETLFVATEDPQSRSKDGGVGKPLNGIRISFADDQELLVQADWVLKGYIGRTDTPTKDEWFPSGDLGRLDKEGFLHITGRKKDLIIRGGMNLSPRAIELIVSARPDFEEVAIVGQPDETLGEKTVCFYVKSASFRENACPEANAEVVAKLGSAYRIDQFIALDALPRNMNGKIDTNKLKAYDHRA